MAKLTAEKRKKIPKKEFGEPSSRKYPMPDRRHASLAKSYARQEMEKGKLSKAEYDKICAKADKKLYGND
jgi:hypothetical protein